MSRRDDSSERKTLCGVLVLDKPQEWTSRDAVNRIQNLIRPAKVGHAGTLDPLATGVLVLCVGRATKLISEVQSLPKHYRGTFQMGVTSDTEDTTGTLKHREVDAWPTRDEIEAALPEFIGAIEQRPPKFSAVHIDGQRAYDRARRGENFEVPTRTVHVESIRIVSYEPPELTLDIVCGSGTYIRSIGRDLGECLGCGMAMSALIRTRIGCFDLEHAINPADTDVDAIIASLRAPLDAVRHLPSTVVSDVDAEALRNGRRVPLPTSLPKVPSIVVIDRNDELVAVAELKSQTDELQPRIVFPQVDTSGRSNSAS